MKFPTKVTFTLILFLTTFGTFHAFAQTTTPAKKDSTFPVDSTTFYKFSENGFQYGNIGELTPLINRLDGFQSFHQRQASTGNAGAPEKQLQLFPSPSSLYISPSSFQRSSTVFYGFGFTPATRNFYTSDRPYTKIQFIVGQKQELNVGVVHAHPFGKNCNVAFGFNRIRSTGFYQRQNTNNTGVNLNGWYRAPGKRYALLADLYWNAFSVAENGGIKNDSDFEFSNQLDRHIVQVNLLSAETRQRFRGAFIKEYWSFGNVSDTISDKNDSLHIKTKIYPSWAIVHTVNISDEKYIYLDGDPQSGFYSNVFRDTTQTRDSTYLWKIENGLWLERFQLHDDGKIRKVFGKIGLRHEAGEIFNDTIYNSFSNFLIDGSLSFAKVDKEGWKKFIPDADLKAWMVLNGYNQGDYFLNARIVKQAKYAIGIEQKRQHPDFIYSHYSGNHFEWTNDFYSTTQTAFQATGFKFFGKGNLLAVSAGFYNYVHPLYFDENKLPAQYASSVNAISGRVYFSLGSKSLKTKTDFSWNKLPSNSPIRLPEVIIRESVYGNFNLFKKALQLQVGIDATWFSAYYADGYNPNIAQFYVQDSKKIGNYVFLDPWLSIKVKPVRVFVKADHANAGLMGRTYYMVPHHPQNDFALKFGLSWVFND